MRSSTGCSVSQRNHSSVTSPGSPQGGEFSLSANIRTPTQAVARYWKFIPPAVAAPPAGVLVVMPYVPKKADARQERKSGFKRVGCPIAIRSTSSLERLVHTTIFATTRSPGFDLPRQVPPRHHEGVRPSKYSAWARTRESCSLSSTSASNSARSASVKSPSVWPPLRLGSGRSALRGHLSWVRHGL